MLNIRHQEVRNSLLKKAGCLFAAIGVESGSIKILKKINKKIAPKKVIRAFTIFKRHMLHAYPLLMVGNPGETDETIDKTIKLMKIIRPTQLAISKKLIFPGTKLYEIVKVQGVIDDKFWLTSKPPPFYTYEHSLKKLKKWEFLIQYFDKKNYQIRILQLFFLIKKQ